MNLETGQGHAAAPAVAAFPATLGAGRFEIDWADPHTLRFVDRLQLGERRLAACGFAGLHGKPLRRALLRRGCISPIVGGALRTIADRPRRPQDVHFWQFPARTEAVAASVHGRIAEAVEAEDEVHVYLALPWATWIDHRGIHRSVHPDVEDELFMQRVRFRGWRQAFRSEGCGLRVHTVCQHIHWRRLLPVWRELGVTDLWLSHAPPASEVDPGTGIRLHPWALYALNVEDPARRHGLRPGLDPADRPLLASFIGAHQAHYLSDIRLRLESLRDEPHFLVELSRQWHLHEVVYEQQLRGRTGAGDGASAEIERYNHVLSESVFSLCPAGAGPNSIRLWESLAVGAIPVLLGPRPALPPLPAQAGFGWNDVVLECDDEDLPALPARLRAIGLEERRRRQRLARHAYDIVRERTTFPGEGVTSPSAERRGA